MGRPTFRYGVYVANEVAWSLIALYLFIDDTLTRKGGLVPPWLAYFLVVLSVAHSMKMTLMMPWLLLKSVLLGGIVFAGAYVLLAISGLPSNPSILSVITASGYYYWIGELWTRRSAMAALTGHMDRRQPTSSPSA